MASGDAFSHRRDRRRLLSHCLNKKVTYAATRTLRKAKRFAANAPKRIRTDKLGSYSEVIKWVLPDAEHIQSDGITAVVNNHLSERVQGTFRSCTKTLRGLENRRTVQRFLDGWVMNYNLFRKHEGAGGFPPAKRAGVSPPFEEWADVVGGPSPSPRRPSGGGVRQPSPPRKAQPKRGRASAGRIASAKPR